jgi:hypothetical protein
MEIGARRRHGRPNDKEIHKAKESKTTTKDNDQITRQSTTRIKKTRHNQDDDNNQSKIQNQEQNPHPAWNPDSRWSA